jgi:ParB-like chromosome segregation protein Spo0J
MSDRLHASALVPLAALGERLGGLRLRDASGLDAMQRSLARHGQLTAVVLFGHDGELEMLDGFKRLHAARALGWNELRATTSDVTVADAKVQIAALHDGRGLTELEEAWLVRSLYRDDGLSQPEIARRLSRHKSWVCRRLLLVESLEPELQAAVRLGVLVPRAAVALAALPRGNQRAGSEIVVRRGLTVRQTELLVVELLDLPDDTARAAILARRLESGAAATAAARPPSRALRSEADWMAADVATLLRVGARLEARLLGTPLGALGASAGGVVFDGLVALTPVLAALARTIGSVTGRERAA